MCHNLRAGRVQYTGQALTAAASLAAAAQGGMVLIAPEVFQQVRGGCCVLNT